MSPTQGCCATNSRKMARPERCPHLSAFDDALIDAARRFGPLLGGGRRPDSLEQQRDLRQLHEAFDRLCEEYAAAVSVTGMPVEVRAGQIIGTAQLMAIRARIALGTAGPVPFEGQLDGPGIGVVAGRGQMVVVDEARPWAGGRWIVQADDGRRFPLTLSMLLFDSSGVNKDAALDEHRQALSQVTAAAGDPGADLVVAAGAVEWLLYDWLMAHRESDASAAIEIRNGHEHDATMIIEAAAAGARCRGWRGSVTRS